MTEHKEQSDKVFSMDAPLNKTLRWENKIRIHRSLLDSQFIDQIMCPKTPNIWLNTQIFPDEKGRFYGSGSGSDPDPIRSVSTLHRRLHPGFANRSRRSSLAVIWSLPCYTAKVLWFASIHHFCVLPECDCTFSISKVDSFFARSSCRLRFVSFGGNVWASLI